MRHKRTIIGGLLALCGLALLVEYVSYLGSDFTGDHLAAGILMLAAAVIFWCLSSEANKE
jgi:drug/metabolite transporter (DMT)-like permease